MALQKPHQPLFVLRKHSSAVMTCALDELGLFQHYLLSGDVDGVVIFWDLELRAPLLLFHAVNTALQKIEDVDQHNNNSGGVKASFTNNGVMKVGFFAFSGTDDMAKRDTQDGSGLPVYFYTQCRNKCLYIWRVFLPGIIDSSHNDFEEGELPSAVEASLELLHTIKVPQNGFCAVPSVSLSSSEMQLAVPHDNDGVISLWNVGLVKTEGLANRNLQVLLSTSFSASGAGAKCGSIMCICYRDNENLALAFESGHVTLNNVHGARLAIIRAFAETALTSLWRGDMLLASSAGGQLHCYAVVCETPGTGAGNGCVGSDVSLVVKWEAALRKGVGCVALQRHLVVVGSWDNTLRLYDEGSGRVVSILTFHSGTVHEVSMSSVAATQFARFGYDVRLPRWRCADATPHNEVGTPVFLFASASGDFTIAVWRLDFKVLRAPSNYEV